MDSTGNGQHANGEIEEEFSFHNQITSSTHSKGEIQELEMNGSSKGKKLRDFIPIYIPTVEKGLIVKKNRKQRFFDFLKARPTNDWFLRFGFRGSQRGTSTTEELTADRPRGQRRRRFRVPFVRKINWKALMQYSKQWIKSPSNVVLFIWVILCAIGIVWVGLFMIGALDGVMPDKDQRDRWEEVINQVVNALFTLMVIYQHPLLMHHLVLVIRWRPDDQVAARKVYSKNGVQRPNERAHIAFVLFLLHLTCVAQYMYCALFWGWSRRNRPDWPQYVCIAVGVAAPVWAAWYTYYGPLAKDTGETRTDEESQSRTNGDIQLADNEVSEYHRRVIVTAPEWIGGLFDCWDDTTGVCLSFFCTCCVFGWNMERLGFGNMYVHIFTFVILCVSPFWIFYISANNVDDDSMRLAIAICGGVCCLFGLLYGGYWRSEMRKKFKLPANPLCCGYALVTDFAYWLFCWSCSLAQEIRTANFYDIEDDGFYRRVTDEEGRAVLVPLPREGNFMNGDGHRSFSCPPKLEDVDVENHREVSGGCSPVALGRSSTYSKVHAMKPPLPPLMQRREDE